MAFHLAWYTGRSTAGHIQGLHAGLCLGQVQDPHDLCLYQLLQLSNKRNLLHLYKQNIYFPLDPPLNALSWNLKTVMCFLGPFIFRNERKKLEFREMGGSALIGGFWTPLGPL